MRALVAYAWPGNVRELSNVIERAVLLAPGQEITPADLPDTIASPLRAPAVGPSALTPWSPDDFALPLDDARRHLVESFEHEYLDHHLRLTQGNVGRTADAIGIDPRTLFNKMKLYGLRKENYR
jgi:two-component system, NtrC family, response regulator AtoC